MKVLYTGEDFARLTLEGRCELVRGEIVPLTPPGFEHGEIALNVGSALREYARRTRGGRAVVESGVYTEKQPDTVRGPDAAFWHKDRIEGAPAGFVDVSPDVVVEVVSPSDSSQEVEQKVQEYLRAGVRSAWVLYPKTRTVHIFAQGGTCRVLQSGDQLEVPDVLPGFSWPVTEFFPD